MFANGSQIKAVLKYKNMKTHLEDSHNNKRVKKDESKKLLLSDVISSVEFRIAKHREFIKRDEQVIVDNVDCANFPRAFISLGNRPTMPSLSLRLPRRSIAVQPISHVYLKKKQVL